MHCIVLQIFQYVNVLQKKKEKERYIENKMIILNTQTGDLWLLTISSCCPDYNALGELLSHDSIIFPISITTAIGS